MFAPARTLVAPALATLALACGHTSLAVTPFPHGDAVQLLDGAVHLGDGRAEGQSFSAGGASAARVCALVNMPATSDVYLQVRDVRETETLANQLTVNGRGYALPATLERDPHGVTSNAMSASPVERVRLEQGPSEICLVAGHKANGDLDDFEVSGLTLFVEGVDVREVGVRRSLLMGAPDPSQAPSVPWGQRQSWANQGAPFAPAMWGRH